MRKSKIVGWWGSQPIVREVTAGEKLAEWIDQDLERKKALEAEIIEANFAVKSSEATEEEVNESNRLVANDKIENE